MIKKIINILARAGFGFCLLYIFYDILTAVDYTPPVYKPGGIVILIIFCLSALWFGLGLMNDKEH